VLDTHELVLRLSSLSNSVALLKLSSRPMHASAARGRSSVKMDCCPSRAAAGSNGAVRAAALPLMLRSWAHERKQTLMLHRDTPCAAQAAVLGGACAADAAGLPILRGLRAARLHLAHPGSGGRHGSARRREQHCAGESPLQE
jgi:hypothetical protein